MELGLLIFFLFEDAVSNMVVRLPGHVVDGLKVGIPLLCCCFVLSGFFLLL